MRDNRRKQSRIVAALHIMSSRLRHNIFCLTDRIHEGFENSRRERLGEEVGVQLVSPIKKTTH